VFGNVNFYPEAAKRAGIVRMYPFFNAGYGYDRIQGGYEGNFNTGFRLNTTRQGFIHMNHEESYQTWQGQRFDTGTSFNIFGVGQIFSWLQASFGTYIGHAIFYERPFQGKTHGGGTSVTWQPNAHFSEDLGYDWLLFDHADTGRREFSAHIVNSKTIYQFDRHFQIRLLEEFDSSASRLLTDLLGSYEFIPGTVFFAGYGSLAERRQFDGHQFLSNQGDYLTLNRGFFFKASYLHRF